jgi:hypothetical protein
MRRAHGAGAGAKGATSSSRRRRRQGSYEIDLGSLRSKQRVSLMRADAAPVWAAPGYLVTMRNRRLVAHRFGPDALKLVGDPIDLDDAPPADGSDGISVVSASRTGILTLSSSRLSNTKVTWCDRTGARQGTLTLPVARWMGVSLSDDGRRAMIGKPASADEGDWWLVELDSGVAKRFAEGILSAAVVWSPSGDRVAYQASKSGPADIYVQSVDGGGEQPLVVSDVLFKNPNQWTPDGKYVVFEQPDPTTGWDIWRVPVDGDRKPEPVVRAAGNQRGGWVSPDGRWIAYTSDESGRSELYIQSYPQAGRRVQATTTGVGIYAIVRWSRNGRELVTCDERVQSIDFEPDGPLRVGPARELFTIPSGVFGFAADADLKRFLIVEPVEEPEPAAIEVDVNWAAAIKP